MTRTGQDPGDPFFSYTMAGTTNYLYPNTPLPNNSQFKCYDGYHNLNQLQPAPYDGLYQFPSATCLSPGATFTLPGNTTAYHCATIANPAFGQTGAAGMGALPAILPAAKYVTEVIVPTNWELNKEEDLNLLIGDQYIAPAVAQFGGAGLGNIFITPDQASIDAANPSYTGPYTAANPYTQPFSNCTTPGVASTCTFTPSTTNNGKQAGDYGRTTFGSFGPGGIIQQNAPCVGLLRIVPDYLSISPESGEVAPFAGYSKNLCDRKEVTLEDQMQANADFFIWTKVAKAVTFTGFISDDFSSEFDPASPAFGEKFAIPNVPVSIKDFNGNEVSRLYSDQWGIYNGLVYGSWEVNVPNAAYSGPAATSAPYNQKFVTRHYGFGAGAHVTIGGVAATCTGGDIAMTCTVPLGVPTCPLLQTNPLTGVKIPAQCGQLVITTAPSAAYPRGQQSIDTVTVTIGGKAPSYVHGENATNNAIQKAIDSALSGDLIIVGPGTYNELLLMWKPLRLQGVGTGSVIGNPNTHPPGKLLEPWRRQGNCLF